MKPNLTLIGMPGAGKSTIGIILAKGLSFGFIDTDILIQINRQKSLQQIIDETGHINLREIEETEILKINVENQVIATGGSAVYSETAMTHLTAVSTIVFLKVGYDDIAARLHNFSTRGIARPEGQTLRALYDERQGLYNRYAGLTIDCNGLNQDEIAVEISKQYTRRGYKKEAN
jgi:shikimate kinase